MLSIPSSSLRTPRRAALSRSQACPKGLWSRSSASPSTTPPAAIKTFALSGGLSVLAKTADEAHIPIYFIIKRNYPRKMVSKMTIESLKKFWPLMYAIIQEFWRITEPHIEDAAVRNDLPIELYLYSELGLERFSIKDFEKRDPFSNPE